MFPNDSNESNDSNAPCNNSPPRKKQRMHCITTSNEEFKFPSGNNEYNEQEIKFILNAMKIHTYGQRKVIAALLFYSFLTAGFTPEQACSCIKLLFQKACNVKVNVIHTRVVPSTDDEDATQDSDATHDLQHTPSQTPESQKLTQDSMDDDFLDDENDENAHMLQEDEDFDETNIIINDTQSSSSYSPHKSQTSNVSDAKSQSSSVCF